MSSSSDLTRAFEHHRRFVWAIGYRLTGSVVDADEVVQETFLRALKQGPKGEGESWRPWLAKVATNLGIDALRRRKRQPYVGQWLPAPLDTEEASAGALPEWQVSDGGEWAARHDRLDSVSYAFLVALEALTPTARAVLILRDVFDYSVRETAEALSLSEVNVRTTHHRARAVLKRRKAQPVPITPDEQSRVGRILARFLDALGRHDVGAIEALLAEDARVTADGAGQYVAALNVIHGANRAARFMAGILVGHDLSGLDARVRMINGLPAFVAEDHHAKPRYAPRYVMRIEVDDRERITDIQIVVADAKVRGVFRPG